jgi:hypothetical protein
MDKDIDFMAHVDENTPPETVFKMLLAAQRDKLKTNEEKNILADEVALLRKKVIWEIL